MCDASDCSSCRAANQTIRPRERVVILNKQQAPAHLARSRRAHAGEEGLNGFWRVLATRDKSLHVDSHVRVLKQLGCLIAGNECNQGKEVVGPKLS